MDAQAIINKLTAEVLHQTDVEGIRQCIAMAVAGGYNLGQSQYVNNKSVIQMTKDGRDVRTFASQTDASKATGIKQCDISDCCLNKRNRTHAGGYKWKFAKLI
jgi:hypothetical protein